MNDARAWWIDVADESFDHEGMTLEIQGLEDEFGITRALAKWSVAHGLALASVVTDADDAIVAMAFAGADGEVGVDVFFEDMD